MVKGLPVRLMVAFIMLAGLAACQRVIDVDITSTAPKLVIEANLTDVTGTQTVLISRSVAYASSNVFPGVSGATVSFTEGTTGRVYKLKETTTPGTYAITSFRGRAKTLYTLNVTVDNHVYTASGVMPVGVPLDSLTLTNQIFGSTKIKTIAVNYFDPPNEPNQYKFVLYVNNAQVKHIFDENDNLTDGRVVSSSLYQRDVDIKSGDVVDVDMQCIDANMYSYWDNLSSQGSNSPQASATPANPPSNFFNADVLGYFSVHTVQRKSILIP
ncbi:uncharacterized protein DUF4249 [Mucilaginibacter gracilis]|uniref:Uncharacterized protein DUF4249 n=1 Tax=Mucilaginibacter gracilis TaxID=423350 RepID=A0A495J756_9SPHI|nr:DUF4249 domain-containing protein [Mucilaginibacter gracilis]RKR84825.1 uncharacterized protein DUF4249 [Mucilaginibacter gracilis]